ncbi:hypothetical protein [Virgibacillus salexigens]|uniref:WXG100 family type VII secretion target n=1 Tax=Virgibacillus kapii TaxID=1638645 RepID=A0ABQ2DL04_9BACI|nr:hypothetical protein [Virgibacillus kapii]GGJ61778.1 hypothetical protein GCM10007111_24860 [Virgibacillus kapii]
MDESINLSMFMKSDQENAAKNLSNYEKDMMQGLENVLLADFGEAAQSFRNAANWMDNLALLRDQKINIDNATEELTEKQKEAIRRNFF